MKLFDYINAINSTKKPLLDTEDEQVEKGYVPFFVNRTLSYFPDTILQANQMNLHGAIDKKMQFDYLLHSIRPRKRYSKWLKNKKTESVESIKKYYNYSNKKAMEALEILSEEEIKSIEERYGGEK